MVAGIVLSALVVAAGTLGRTGWVGPPLLAVLSVVWFQVNKSMEGEVLWVVTSSRGLTGADLAGIAGLLLAGWRAVELARGSAKGE